MEWENVAAQGWALIGYGNEEGFASQTPDVIDTAAPDQSLVSPTTPYTVTNPYTITGDLPSPLSNRFPQTTRKCVALESVPRKRATQKRLEGASKVTTQSSKASAAKQKWSQRLKSDASVRLPTGAPNMHQLLQVDTSSLSLAEALSQSGGADRVLEKMSESTGTFMKPGTDRSIHIWGDPDQVAEAKRLLQRLIEKFYEKTVDGYGGWLKIHPNEFKEDIQKARIEKAIKDAEALLREEPKKGNSKRKMIFVWPQDGPSPQESFGDKLEVLDYIRQSFKVHIYLETDVDDCIAVCGNEEMDLTQIAVQLRESWKAAVAKADIRIKAFLIELPKSSTMQSQVQLVKRGGFALPLLHDRSPVPPPATREEGNTIESLHKANDHIMLQSFQKALSKAHFFVGYLRMRIHLGSFVMDSYRKPKNRQSQYGLEEFQDMIMDKRATGRLLPGLKLSGEELLSRCMKECSLLESTNPLITLSGIKTAIPTYSANFEFSGDIESLFRLEVDFNHRALEIEQKRHRWLKAHDQTENPRRMVLQVGVINFAKPDWQGDIELFEPLHGDEIPANLLEFLKTVRFDNRIRVHGMTVAPRKKVLFEYKAPVASFIEKASVQLKIKGTSYVIEVARFDRYTRTFTGWTTEPTVSWGVTLFDPTWDMILGSGLNMEGNAPKKREKYLANFQSFFPSRAHVGPEGEEHGFWELIGIVDKVLRLLKTNGDTPEGRSADLDKNINPGLLGVELGMLF